MAKFGNSGSVAVQCMASVNVVNWHWARLVLGWVTVNHLELVYNM